jgi:hypothetical protein
VVGLQPRLTDVDGTYRALWRDTYQRIRPYLSEDGPALSPEMMIEPRRRGDANSAARFGFRRRPR